jgi:hypothetical protein
MKKTKIIVEQATDKEKLIKARDNGCYPTWLKYGKTGKSKDGKAVYFGKNEKDETVVFYADMTAENLKTGKRSKWVCPALELSQGTVSPSSKMSVDQEKVLNRFIQDNPSYQLANPGEEYVGEGREYTKVDVSTLPELKDKFTEPGKTFIYKKSGFVGKTQDYVTQFGSMLSGGGYTFDVPPAEKEYLLKAKRKVTDIIGSRYSESFGTSIPFVYMTEDEYTRLVNLDKSTCRKSIKQLYDSFKDPDRSTMELSQRIKLKNEVWFCSNRNFAPGILGMGNELEELQSISTSTNPYGLKNFSSTKQIYESIKNNHLKKLVRENLLEIKIKKKRSLIKESKIVKDRFRFIVENVNLETKKHKDKFCNDLLNEMIYMNSQGYDKQVINEGFFDVLKSLFGNTGESIMQYFKEYFAKWLISTITPLDPEGWIGGTITKAVGNLDISDIPKLTDCNFTTKLISKSVAEEAIDQLKNKAGMEGAFYDILRNAVVESLSQSDLGQKIESSLGNVLCPSLSKVSSKMSDVTDTMKKRALSIS